MATFIEVTPRDEGTQTCSIATNTIEGVVLIEEGGELVCVIHTTWADPLRVEESYKTIMARIGSEE